MGCKGTDAGVVACDCRMMDAEDGSNPELFTKKQLEKCRDESEQAAAKVETLEMLKDALQAGLQEEIK